MGESLIRTLPDYVSMKKSLLLTVLLAFGMAAQAETLEIQEYLGYMWKGVTEVNYGEVVVNSTTRYTKNGQPLKLASDVSFSSVSFTPADGTISASINPDKTIYLNITPSETGEYTSNITVSPGL